MESYLRDDVKMQRVSTGFSKRSPSLPIGFVRVIDEWLIRVQRPTFARDGIPIHHLFTPGKASVHSTFNLLLTIKRGHCEIP